MGKIARMNRAEAIDRITPHRGRNRRCGEGLEVTSDGPSNNGAAMTYFLLSVWPNTIRTCIKCNLKSVGVGSLEVIPIVGAELCVSVGDVCVMKERLFCEREKWFDL